MLVFTDEKTELEYKSANSARERLKPYELALEMLLDVVSKYFCEPRIPEIDVLNIVFLQIDR